MKTSPFLGWWPSSPCADTKVFTAAWWCGDLGAAWNHGATCWHHKGVHFRSATVEVPKGGQFQPFDSKPLDSLCCTFEKTPFDTLRCPSSYPPYFLPHSIQCLKVAKQSQDKAQLPCSRIESKFLQKVFGKGGGCLNRSGFFALFWSHFGDQLWPKAIGAAFGNNLATKPASMRIWFDEAQGLGIPIFNVHEQTSYSTLN